MKISIQKDNVSYLPKSKTFIVAGTDVKFGTSHILKNEKTGKEIEFTFKESTGSEWDKWTVWIYESLCSKYHLHVSNNDTTPAHADAYLKAKLKI